MISKKYLRNKKIKNDLYYRVLLIFYNLSKKIRKEKLDKNIILIIQCDEYLVYFAEKKNKL